MARDTLLITQLPGVDRNRVKGFNPDGVLSPQKAYNLVPDRRGGYAPFGRVETLLEDDGLTPVTIPNLPNMIGNDFLGISSFATAASGSGRLQLFKGNDTLSQQTTLDYAAVERAAHIAGAGAYISRDQFMLLHRSGVQAEPLTVGIDVAQRAVESGGVITSFTGANVTDVRHAHGRWVICTSAGEIYTSDNDGLSWDLRYDGPDYLSAIAAGNANVWVVVGWNESVVYSSDNGATWTVGGAMTGMTNSFDVEHVGGTNFVAVGYNIMRSTDDGATWTQVTNPDQTCTTVLHRGGRTVAILNGPMSPAFDGPNQVAYSDDNGATWTYSPGAGVGFWEVPIEGTVSGAGQFVALGENCAIDISSDGVGPYSQLSRNVMGAGIPNDIHWSTAAESYFLVGDGGAALQSTDGIAWTPYDGFGADSPTDNILAVWANEDNGKVIMVGANGLVIATESTIGMQKGSYRVHLVSYFNTEAGKFAFDYQVRDVVFNEDSGNKIDVKVSNRQKVKDDTSAGGFVPADSLLEDVRVDVYLQYFGDEGEVGDTTTGVQPEDTGSIEPQPLIVYDFTAVLPGSLNTADVPELEQIGTIEDLPLGSRLGGEAGSATTIVFEKSQTAIHNGRVWGLVSQDESLWPQNDNAPLEIANQFGSFVLGYTETNWANLMRPDNYIPITPSQSTNYTGMVSTPSGLMVMFDNEIFLITGDPALGGMSVEVYSDLVGNDLGVKPCKMGGVPFVIWDGQIYALQGGQALPVSAPVFRQDDHFVRVAPEPQERSLLALTESGEVFRYDVEHQFWSNNALATLATGAPIAATGEFLPNCVCQSGDNTRFVLDSGAVRTVRRDGTPDAPYLVYRGIDYGDSLSRHGLYRVQLPVEDLTLGATPPRLYYKITNQDDVEDGVAPSFVDAIQREEQLEWTLPMGLKGRLHDLKLELNGATYDSVMMPSLLMEFSTTERRR